MKPYVYLITNLINNKQYVGSHIGNKKYYMGGGTILIKAQKKYGKKQFQKEILVKCDTLLEARKLEEFYIIKHQTKVPNGYNIHPSGGSNFKGSLGLKHTQETKQKISEKNKGHKRAIGELNPMFGKKHSDKTKKIIGFKSAQKNMSIESRLKISIATKGSKNPMYGVHRSDAVKEKIREKLSGRTLSKETISKMKKKYKCKYCDKEMNKSNLTRYHNDNCKNK